MPAPGDPVIDITPISDSDPAVLRLDRVRVTYPRVRHNWKAGLALKPGVGIDFTLSEQAGKGVLLEISNGNGSTYYTSTERRSADLSQQLNGNASTLTLPEPAVPGTVRLYRNGQRLILGKHFTTPSSTTVSTSLLGTLSAGQDLEAEYEVLTGTAQVSRQADLSDQASVNVATYTLPEEALEGSMRVYRNGQRLVPGRHFTEASATTFTLMEGLRAKVGEDVEVEYAVAAP